MSATEWASRCGFASSKILPTDSADYIKALESRLTKDMNTAARWDSVALRAEAKTTTRRASRDALRHMARCADYARAALEGGAK